MELRGGVLRLPRSAAEESFVPRDISLIAFPRTDFLAFVLLPTVFFLVAFMPPMFLPLDLIALGRVTGAAVTATGEATALPARSWVTAMKFSSCAAN